MNHYSTAFSALCPVNGDLVRYSLLIESTATVMAEDIEGACNGIGCGLHEAIADQLVDRLRGKQTLTAIHRGVHITTTRIK